MFWRNKRKRNHEIPRWSTHNLFAIRSLHIVHNDRTNETELRCEFLGAERENQNSPWPPPLGSEYILPLRFQGIQNLKLKGLGPLPFYLARLEIKDIEVRGWGFLKFEIQDLENEAIHFYCRAYQVDSEPG